MKERKILEIQYLDHVQLEHGEDGVNEIRKAEPLVCTAYGELLKETPVFVTRARLNLEEIGTCECCSSSRVRLLFQFKQTFL